jgi:EAL domain-containing protein (putative c-di-GMP-specific phosphodiesterase class I)
LQEYLLKYALKYDIKPSNVILEILEDIASLSQSNTLFQLHALRKKGFKIAIDDFGSESSNLSRLLEFNPDFIKIDGSFIKNILEDEKSLIIVEAIVLIAKRSKIKVIAEYVHSKEVQEKVTELGIEYSQGYFFSEPRRDTHSTF